MIHPAPPAAYRREVVWPAFGSADPARRHGTTRAQTAWSGIHTPLAVRFSDASQQGRTPGTMKDIVQSPSPSSELMDAFLSRREALLRYFAARVGEADAQDIVQDIYLRIVSTPGDIEVRQPGGYLYKLGNNILLDRLRQQRARTQRDSHWRETHHQSSVHGEDVSDTVPQDEVLIARDQLQRMEVALADLPEGVQTSFRLHKIEGLTHGQVAERMGVSKSLIEKHMMAALRHLATRLDRRGV